MHLTVAKHAGACYGVKRAMALAQEAAQGGKPVCTLGPLIHNPGVVAALEDQGVFEAPTVDAIHTPGVVIRSHGVTPEVLEQLEQRSLDIIDATCPHVARAQKAAAALAEEGLTVIVVGEEGHPEVEGLRAYAERAGASVFVASSAADLPKDLSGPVGVVVQTTQKQKVLDEVGAALKAQGLKPKVKNTICSATTLRQEEAAALAKSVDLMIVLGGRNSSNTTRLAEICAEGGAITYHIESASELNPAWFESVESVGLTAGASTPQEQIDGVVAKLQVFDS